jgi:hypothetical protein
MDRERDEDFGSTIERVVPQCQSCKHYDARKDACPAFPRPGTIPLVIRLNRFDHKRSLWPGQVGEAQWQPKNFRR